MHAVKGDEVSGAEFADLVAERDEHSVDTEKSTNGLEEPAKSDILEAALGYAYGEPPDAVHVDEYMLGKASVILTQDDGRYRGFLVFHTESGWEVIGAWRGIADFRPDEDRLNDDDVQDE